MRVPTYQNYMNMLDQTLRNKSTFELYNFQTLTGLKSPNYAGYGMQAYNIVGMEAALNLNETFIQNNAIVNTEVKAMNTSLDSIYKTVNNFKSMLTSFGGNASSNITPDYTGGQITFTNDTVADYVGQTITVDGTTYTFGNVPGPGIIDISAAADADGVMAALYAAVSINPDITYNGTDTINFPLYTVDGPSTVLNVSGVTTGEPYLPSSDQVLAMQELQTYAFSTMLMMADSLNINLNGKYLFGGGVSNAAPVDFPFRNLEEFQKYYDGVNILYPTNSAADLSSVSFNASATGAITLAQTGGNTGTITAANTGGFLKEAIIGNASTVGTLTFNTDKNTINSTEYGAFNTLKAGDTIVIGGAAAGVQANSYVIKEISTDGKTITVDETYTPIQANGTISPNNDLTFSTSFPIGSVVNMEGFGPNIAPEVQVTGVSADGTTLLVTADPSRFPNTVIPVSSQWSLNSSSYYQGGDLVTEKRISENQSLVFDINANDPVFEKIFRALGMVAQGNLADTRNPADAATNIDPNNAAKRCQEALDLIYEALYDPQASGTRNADLYTVMAKVSSNYVVLDNCINNQTLVENNLKNDIYSLKNVDQTEAATKSLIAKNNLDASYAVLQQALNTSLLNYIK